MQYFRTLLRNTVTKLSGRKSPDRADECCSVSEDVKMEQYSFINTCSLGPEGRIKALSMIKHPENKISPDTSTNTTAETEMRQGFAVTFRKQVNHILFI